jgi:putative hydrolase of the HAD superfamily
MVDQRIYVRAVFFDAVGTLFQVRGSVGRIYYDLARSHGVRSTPEAIDKAFKEVFEKAPPLCFPGIQAGSIRKLEKQWWYGVVSRVFQQVGGIERFDEYFESVFKVFSGSGGWELYPDTERVLSELKKRNLTLGIISNFDSRIYPVLSELGIFRFMDSVHISSHEGAAKPDAGIFTKAVSDHGLHPREALHVGDNFKEDVAGAQTAGLQAIYLNRDGSSFETATHSIHRLSDLLPLVHKL